MFFKKLGRLSSMAEQALCKRQVVSSTLTDGSINMPRYQSGQLELTVNQLAYAYGGSNPSLGTKIVLENIIVPEDRKWSRRSGKG